MTKLTTAEVKQLLAQKPVSADLLAQLKIDERKSVQSLLLSYERKCEQQRKLIQKYEEMLYFEKEAWTLGFQNIAGVDEVGRGPLAGPVVSAAVILPRGKQILGLNDSKQVSDKKRKQLLLEIQTYAVGIGIGMASVEEIDTLNIYQASRLAMTRAIGNLSIPCDYLCVDAMNLDAEIPQKSIIKGDARSVSIAAASIVAKETRDQLMVEYAKEFPGYGFEKHVGYGTKEHLKALKKLGVTPIHRRSFAPVKNLL